MNSLSKIKDAGFGGVDMRSFWAIDERQTLVTWAQTLPGKLTLLAFAFLALTMTLSWQEAFS